MDMVDKLTVLWELLKGNVAKFLEIDFNSVRYENAGLAVWFGYALAAVVFAKIVLDITVKKPARTDSGYVIKTRHKQGFAVRFGYFIPKLALLCVAVLAIRTLTGPFINEFRETEETIESRTIIFLVDGSSSMLEIFLGSKDKESKAEIGNKIVLDLLRSRLGKKDRASYWLFASNPYPVQGFTTNDQMFYIQVDDAPWAVSSCSKLPPGRCANVKDSSGTALNIALQRLIIYIDEDEGASMASQIYLFIVSDAEVYGDPENELKSIQRRNVVPHLVFIAGKKFTGTMGKKVIVLGCRLNRSRHLFGKYIDMAAKFLMSGTKIAYPA